MVFTLHTDEILRGVTDEVIIKVHTATWQFRGCLSIHLISVLIKRNTFHSGGDLFQILDPSLASRRSNVDVGVIIVNKLSADYTRYTNTVFAFKGKFWENLIILIIIIQITGVKVAMVFSF